MPRDEQSCTGTQGPSPIVIGVFLLAGLAGVGCGASWAFNVRGIAVRRAEGIRQRQQPVGLQLAQPAGSMWTQSWYHRVLGAAMTGAGLVMVVAGYALWHLR
ncbi:MULTISPECIES: hypothetical protein [unclassified Streptomyces]|uniref:hypothetical protein n=1 Tax=unclassified Streptomyces TaxID=2593676 RepID=UPI0032540543